MSNIMLAAITVGSFHSSRAISRDASEVWEGVEPDNTLPRRCEQYITAPVGTSLS